METRIFIALTLSKNICDYLAEIVSKLSKLDFKAGWTKPGNFHLTLKFLGNVSDSFIPRIIEGLDEINPELPKSFELTSISGFPNLGNPRVLWYGINDEISKNLYHQTQDVCEKLSFDRDKKPFKSHLTLGRIKSTKTFGLKEMIGETINNSVNGLFEKLALVKSDLSKEGPTYTSLWEKE
jgi:RNA 2',3'-cyclic 3'-phosphodiesterase